MEFAASCFVLNFDQPGLIASALAKLDLATSVRAHSPGQQNLDSGTGVESMTRDSPTLSASGDVADDIPSPACTQAEAAAATLAAVQMEVRGCTASS